MADAPQRYRLRPVRSSREWAAYHAIRRDAIFATLLPNQAYDERDPDEFAPDHFPHLLLRDGEVLGTVRIDLIGRARRAFVSSASGPTSSGKAMAAPYSTLRKKPRELSAKPRLSSTPTQARSISTLPMGTAGANGPTRGPIPSGLVRVGKGLPCQNIAESGGCGGAGSSTVLKPSQAP